MAKKLHYIHVQHFMYIFFCLLTIIIIALVQVLQFWLTIKLKILYLVWERRVQFEVQHWY